VLFGAAAQSQARRSLNLRIRVAVVTLALASFVAASAAAQTYYVDNQSATCSNAGVGTEAQPYCTIGAAVAAHNGPGVTIIVKPGVYREQVTVPASGAAGSPFVIRAQGPGVVVDGADDFSGTGLWTLSTGSVYLASTVTWNPLQVFVDGARLTPSTSAPGSLPPNAFVWVSGQGLYVNLGGTNPVLRQTLVGRRNYGFNLFSKSWVTVEGFEVTRTESRGIYMQNPCTDLVIARNRVSFANSYGIQAVNGSRLLIDENVVSDCNLHGIGLTAGTNASTLRNNEAFRMADPNNLHVAGIYLHTAPRNTLVGNRTHHNPDSGINFYTAADSCLAYNNRSWSNGDHGYDHLNAVGTIHIHDVAYGNDMDGFSIEGISPNTRLYNCIGVNNGLTTDEFDLWVNFDSAPGFVSDHNIFWNSTSQDPIKYINTRYASLATYQVASGQDAHSRQADPRFANAAAGDFTLMAGSPAIDAAKTDLPNWPATDVAGGVRRDDPSMPNTGVGPVLFADIGVLEFVPTTDLPPVVVAPVTLKPVPGSTVTFTVTASDPNGQPIQSLTMVPVTMPANSGATFTPNASKTAGTFTWPLGAFTGTFKVRFVASNALTGSATTTIQVKARGGRRDAVESNEEGAVGELAMSNGFPNPSRGDVEFALDLPTDAQVSWAVFDLQGRMVWSEERSMAAGHAQLRWDGMIATRGRAATGVYLVRVRVDGTTFNRRVVRF
jgi:hypothetical protein